jgi:hypothetical protein
MIGLKLLPVTYHKPPPIGAPYVVLYEAVVLGLKVPSVQTVLPE